MKHYEAIVKPGQKYWIVEVPGVGFTQARSQAEVTTMANDLVELMTNEHNFTLEVRMELPASVQQHLDEAQRLREQEAEARSKAAQESRSAAHELQGLGLALQQIGDVLGVSRQRVHQLLQP